MKHAIKYFFVTLLGSLALLVSCQYEDMPYDGDTDEEGYRTIEFMVSVPDMPVVNTRAVDPDGGGVQQMTVFCFDANDLFISTVTVALTPDGNTPSLSGKFKVKVPDHTVTLQLVGNQNLTYFREDNYRGMSEIDVMASLEASAGRMIYWARETIETLPTHNTVDNPVKLLRNQAKITLNVDDSKTNFVDKGWVVVNSNAFGTVAPYSPDHGGFVKPTIDAPFVTLPENRAKLGDFIDVRTHAEEYIFETENTDSDPIDFILKGSQNGGPDLYYRISFIDQMGNNVMIMRNHHYTVNIVGELYYGQPTFEQALEAPATNNVWVSISEDIAEVQDSEYRLAVDKTSVVICENEFESPNNYYLYYTIESLKGESLTQASVTWKDGNNVAASNFTHTFDATTGRGTLVISLNDMDSEQKREGTLFIKKGRLSREIKVITVKEQSFVPAWITTNVYGVGTGENVTMMFTIPDECPEELFPMDVLVSVNALDVRHSSGMILPIIRQGEEGYGEDNGLGYKYVLTVNSTGKQRVYFETALEHETGDVVDVTIEAANFETLTKRATFQSSVDNWIILDNLRSYSAVQPADEVIYFYLVPQKVNAVVEFETHLGTNIVWNSDHTINSYTQVAPQANDEFLLYSRSLDHHENRTDLDFTFYEVASENWATGGRVYGFTRNAVAGEMQGSAVFHMITNRPKSAEVVRIASNPQGAVSVTGSGYCNGSQYRSAIFELANFHPFHFAAQINGQGTAIIGEQEEVVDDVTLSYLPNQPVEIAFDVTSFTSSIRGNDNQILPESEQKSVDPFGTAFDIYIDAPMLALDKTDQLYLDGKVEEHPTIPGRFVYHVAETREQEKAGTISALGVDLKSVVSQEGERKVIKFKTTDIVTSGEITISADESKVVYYTKRFKVQNSSITGRLQYERAEDNAVVDIPAGAFVPFEVEPTYNRIGTISIGEGGRFELRLRGEYEYDWNTDNVKLQYTDENGVVYESTFGSLNALYSSLSGPIILPKR